jgi:hypothetical protein
MRILDQLQWSEPATDSSGKRWKTGSYSEIGGDPERLGSRLDELESAVLEAGGEVLSVETGDASTEVRQAGQSAYEGQDTIWFRCRVPVDDEQT